MAAVVLPSSPSSLSARRRPSAHVAFVPSSIGSTGSVPASSRSVDRRSWWVLVLAVATLLTAVWWVAGHAGGPVAGAEPSAARSVDPAAVGSAPSGQPTTAPADYTVRPGDTLWSIASTLRPGEDPRPVVDELAHRTGGGTLQPGQRIPVDGLG